MKRIIVIFAFLAFASCDGISTEPSYTETTAPITSTYSYEYHFTAPDGIDEYNKWSTLSFSSYECKFINQYKYKTYELHGGGWHFNPKWDECDWDCYDYEIDGNKMRTRLYSISNSNQWSDWTDYKISDTSIAVVIDGTKRIYTKTN